MAAIVQPPLVMLSRSTALRAIPGTCAGGGRLWRTVDGGATWQPTASPTTGLLQLSRDASGVVVVGTQGTCRAQAWRATGTGWSQAARPTRLWYRAADDPTRIVTPRGGVPNPCAEQARPVVAVEGQSARDGVLLCADATIFVSRNGRSFVEQTRLDGAVALDFLSPSRGWALLTDGQRCPAFAVFQTDDAGSSWAARGCVGESTDASTGVVPSVAFLTSRLGLVTIAGRTYRTSDGGRGWSAAA